MNDMRFRQAVIGGMVLWACAFGASAAEWSDTAVGYRFGTRFAEPYNAKDLTKHIFNVTHVRGDEYGTQFLNVDVLLSDHDDSPAGRSSAQESYLVYRYTLDLGKVSGAPAAFAWGPIRGLGLTAGLDYNTKTGDAYQSRKRMLVAGPTVMFDVPGFLNVSVLQLWESNAPHDHPARYYYAPHPMLNMVWSIPLGASRLSFEGYMNYIAAKGIDEFGAHTKPETNVDMQWMYDASAWVSAQPKTFKVGVGYQYWRNKFGNDHLGPAGAGAFAKTPMIRFEYHF